MYIYCVKCKNKTLANNVVEYTSKNNKPMLKGVCSKCGSRVNMITKGSKKGTGVVNALLNKLPEIHLSLPRDVPSEYREDGSFNNTGKYSYCGPGTKLSKRRQQGYRGVNDLDKACMLHDQAYDSFTDVERRNAADNELAQEANRLANDSAQPDYVRRHAKRVAALMSTKSWLGMGTS